MITSWANSSPKLNQFFQNPKEVGNALIDTIIDKEVVKVKNFIFFLKKVQSFFFKRKEKEKKNKIDVGERKKERKQENRWF